MGQKRGSLLALGTVAAVMALPGVLAAQESVDRLRRQYLLDEETFVPPVQRTLPGSSSGSPSAFGASFGDIFVGAGYQQQVRYTDLDDGTVVAGFGLGDARDLIGLEVALTSVSTFRRGFFSHNTASFKVHRLLPGNFGVAVGMENAHVFDEADGGQSIYGAISRVWVRDQEGWLPLRSVTTTIGAGNGRFRFEEDVLSDEETINAFGSVGLHIFEPVSLIADWTGQDLTLALSLAPFARIPIIITPAVADVTGTAGDKPRFILGAGLGYKVPLLSDLF